MAFHYYHATALGPLRHKLFELLKAERRTLLPQTPQTVIVSNLDSEHYLRDYLLECDGVVMGIDFPFLEVALENFSNRATAKQVPLANENWFSAIPGSARKSMAGMLELELALLAVIADNANAPLFEALGYSLAEMNELQLVALAHKLALRFREYLLHTGSALEKKTTSSIVKLWRAVRVYLSEKDCTSMLTHPEIFGKICANFQLPGDMPRPRLYLFGLPILSAFHINTLCNLAGIAEVYLFSVDFSKGDDFHPSVKERYSIYAKMLESSASSFKRTEIAWQPANPPDLEIWSVPGTWRAAEIFADYWHDHLLRSKDLCQYGNQAALSALADDFAAFEKALSSRMLTATSRTRIYEKSHPLCELIGLICDAQQSLDRNLILGYWQNSVVKHAFALDDEKIVMYSRALEKARGFRSDYPDSQDAFNIEEALRRLARGTFVSAAASAVPAVPLREFENPETWSEFLRVLDPLISGPGRLKDKKGQELYHALTDFLQTCHFGTAEESRQLSEILAQMARLTPPGLSFTQLAKLITRFYPPLSLKHGSSREGILFSALSATPFTGENIILYDLGEKLDASRESDPWLAEYDSAPTRLTRHESVLIALESARASGARRVICAYSDVDPVTGAAKYPSQALGEFQAHLAAMDLAPRLREGFPATVLNAAISTFPPLASESDALTISLVRSHGDGIKLSETLLPRRRPAEPRSAISVSELEMLLVHPTRFMLGPALPIEPKLAEFRRSEPRLGAGKSARLQFAEDYLKAAIRDSSDSEIATPSQFIALRRRMGTEPPEGFDETTALLGLNGNENNLRQFAGEERSTTKLVEYILSGEVEKSFTVLDAPRLERRYIPAPRINGVQISGTISGLMERQGELILPLPFIYPNRTVNLARAYLWMSLVDAKPITLGSYATPENKAKQDVIAMDFLPDFTMSASQVRDPGTYVEKLLQLAGQDNFFWFDLALIAPNKLGSYKDASEAEIGDLLRAESRGSDAAEAAYLRRFFDLEADSASYAFFRNFIVPVAELDIARKGKGK